MKHFKKIIAVIMTVCSILSTTVMANAASYDENIDAVAEQTISVATIESSTQITNESTRKARQVIEPKIINNKDEYIDYIFNGDKEFIFTQTEIDINTLLLNSKNVIMLRNGNVTGTFESKKMDTGTPFVTWYYSIDYEIEPYSNGYGWRFVDVQGTVYIHKGILLYTWATSCIVTFESAIHSLNSAKTAVTIDIRLKFDVTTDAIYGVVTYYEDHSHTTSITNLSPY